MTTDFDAPLNESLRNAMLALYLHEAIPNDPYLIEQGLTDRIKTADDLYEYWLLDVLVSQNVPTSPVACAIASLQQLGNGIMMNMEPGYSDVSIEPSLKKAWFDGLNRYPIWAAMQQLHYFAEIYLDPTLRLTKTESFKQLENDINQARIEPETVQAAVLAYLARFEEVSNVQSCNGYIDGEDFANSRYYFVGVSLAENVIFWRSLDMRQRPEQKAVTTGTPPKFDKPLPNAWTDWKKANVPISEKTLKHTIRPCWFNNRLFLIWADVEYQDPGAMVPAKPGTKAEDTVKLYPRFRLYGSYKKYDDNWSTPRVYIDSYCQTPDLIAKTPEEIAKETQTIAVYNHRSTPESMFLALYSNYKADQSDNTGGKDGYDFLRTVRIDKNFNITPLYPANGHVELTSARTLISDAVEEDGKSDVQLIGRIFAHKNAGRCQYWIPTSVPVFGDVRALTPDSEKDTWDFNDWQSRIKTGRKDLELVYDRINSKIQLTVKLDEGFKDTKRFAMSFYDTSSNPKEIVRLILVYIETDRQQQNKVELLEGSFIQAVDSDFFASENAFYAFDGYKNYTVEFITDSSGKKFHIPATAPGEWASLKGNTADSEILEALRVAGDNIELLGPIFKFLVRTINGVNNVLPFHQRPPKSISFNQAYAYQLFIAHPENVLTPEPGKLGEMRTLAASEFKDRLAKDSTLQVEVHIDQNTLHPDWEGDWPAKDKVNIPFIYGVRVGMALLGGWWPVGGALKALTVGWGAQSEADPQIAPSINRVDKLSEGDSPSLGKAQFIDFTGSSIEHSDQGGQVRAPIRMNTTFARYLINYAESGMERLLRWETQVQQTEPPIPNGNGAEAMDFAGAYYLYFLELFLYLPWLVAYRLNEEQRYDEAKGWLAYLFDPARQSSDPGHPGYWQAVPLESAVWPTEPDPSQAVLYPDDPHQIALSFPVYLCKALYGLYLDIESNQADQAYQELTPDGLAEAKLRYVHTLDLLGGRPDARQVDDWEPISLLQLVTAKNQELREFEQRLIGYQRELQEHSPPRIGKAPDSQVAPLLCLRPTGSDSSLSGIDNPWLRRPFNPELIKRWDRAESRLYNLRNNLDMAGNALNLSLFAKPLDPRALLAAWGQGLSGAALSRLLSPQIPHYRFSFMFALAQNAVESVIQFGSTLLSLIERKEQAQYLELQQQQAWNLAKVAVEIQVQAGRIEEANKKALEASQAVIDVRVSYYETLVDEGLSRDEIKSGSARLQASNVESGLGVIRKGGSAARMLPNIFGLANGGIDLGAAYQAVVHSSETSVVLNNYSANNADVSSQFKRRDEDWLQARDQSKLEAKQIEAQLAVFEAQHTATQLQLRQAQTALEQAKATHDFLLSSNRFSKSQTYDWLNSKFASFYYTAYTTAQSLCQAAEACWQYEMGDYRQTFIQAGAWNSSYRGLGAGEQLKTSLQQMHREYLQNNKRELEIRKTVSLRNLKAKDSTSTINKEWDGTGGFHSQLKAGTCTFELTQPMFDDDYQGQNHYLRRIRSISVSLPNVRGPYEDICAVLEQTYSKVEMSATKGANPKDDLRPHQQIALSTGLDDNGLFQLNFQDERYLPFEFSGVVSKWTLTFPNPEAQKGLLENLNDVIIHILYTARRGGGTQ